MSKPIHNKLAAGAVTSGPVAFITWALITYIPAWHSGIPAPLAGALPAAIGLISFFWSGYLAKDDSRFAVDARQLALEAARDLEQLMPQPAPAGARWSQLSQLPGQSSPAGAEHTVAAPEPVLNAFDTPAATGQPGTAGSMIPRT